jgi:DNA (cytosine-5)-methyltransferase 1
MTLKSHRTLSDIHVVILFSEMSNIQIPIIDLFAGPGGLGEGFTSIVDKNNERFFKIALSIEKDEFAHKTLTLRSFLRQFPVNKLPKEYYDFLKTSERDRFL